MAFKKKLYLFHPEKKQKNIETQRTRRKIKIEKCDAKSIERGVRDLLANKISGNMVGLWLLIPEHLRLGTWDLLQSWTKTDGNQVEPRLAMQLINESALCVTRLREKQSLSQKGFEVANGLSFVATDEEIHNLLNAHTVLEAQKVQIALGKIRKTFGHFKGKLIAIDPHRIRTYSQRQMIRRREDNNSKPVKAAQTFFCLDAETKQPLCFETGTSARTVTQATPPLLKMASEILNPKNIKPLVLADNEHYSSDLFDWVASKSIFELMVPVKKKSVIDKILKMFKSDIFIRRWAGYATMKVPYNINNCKYGPYNLFIQRDGEKKKDYTYTAFLCTSNKDEVESMALDYPERWHIEEFFKFYQALGWKRVGTMNLNIQYGKMTMSLIAQSVIHMMRARIGKPFNIWDSQILSNNYFRGLEGDIRVKDDKIIVTFYNAKNCDILRKHYENLPERLLNEGVNPAVPWLYGFKLDFRFK